jgi:hypothetical protein
MVWHPSVRLFRFTFSQVSAPEKYTENTSLSSRHPSELKYADDNGDDEVQNFNRETLNLVPWHHDVSDCFSMDVCLLPPCHECKLFHTDDDDDNVRK